MTHILVHGEDLEVSRLDKPMYPAAGFTKGDLLRYYERIAPVMLPHLAGKPVTVKRYPDGVDGLFFYEKRCPAKRPPWVVTARVASTGYGTIEYCTVDNLQTLIWMANRAAIEFHAYLYRADDERSPTMLILDLDPGAPATQLECLEIAVRLRDLFAQLGLVSFAKTSGGKGLHVAVPIRGAAFDRVKAFARQIAEGLATEQPTRVTASMSKAQRRGKVFIDWSQNDHGKTTACAYTLRAGPRPLVSTPVSWEEIARARRAKKPLVFDADQALRRVERSGDLFAPVLSRAQRLPKLGRGG